MKALLKACLTTALVSLMGSAFAQASPVGLWKTIDDDTNQEKSFVRIVEVSGTLSGKIEKILDATKQDSTCDKCTDGRKNQKVLGMTIIENVKKAAGDKCDLRNTDLRGLDLRGLDAAGLDFSGCYFDYISHCLLIHSDNQHWHIPEHCIYRIRLCPKNLRLLLNQMAQLHLLRCYLV